MTLITPVKILITTALLALYGAYAVWMAVTQQSWIFAVLAVVAVVGCVGAALLKSWSQYLVYLLAASVIGTWAYSAYETARSGYFTLFSSTQDAVLSLARELFFVALSCYCVYAVFTQFRPRSQSSG